MVVCLFGVFIILSMIYCFFVDVISIIKKENIKLCCIRLIEDVIVIGTWTYIIFKYIPIN